MTKENSARLKHYTKVRAMVESQKFKLVSSHPTMRGKEVVAVVGILDHFERANGYSDKEKAQAAIESLNNEFFPEESKE